MGLAPLLALQCCSHCPPFPLGEGLCCMLLSLPKHLAIGSHLNISRAWKPHHFMEMSLSVPFLFAFCDLLMGWVFLFFFYLLPSLVSGFGLPASTARKDSRCHGLAEVCTGKNGQSFSASCEALHKGIAEATGANITFPLVIILNGAVLGGSSFLETLMWVGQKSILKNQLLKPHLDLNFFPCSVLDPQHSAVKSLKRLVCNTHLVFR